MKRQLNPILDRISPWPWHLKPTNGSIKPTILGGDLKTILNPGNARTRSLEQSEADTSLGALAPELFYMLELLQALHDGEKLDIDDTYTADQVFRSFESMKRRLK